MSFPANLPYSALVFVVGASMLLVYIKGLAMGAADVVPGISGGTVAFITGIYERLLRAITHCNLTALRLVLRREIKKAWVYVDGTFLVFLLGGIASSFLLLARLIVWVMGAFPELFWATMFGLILASIVLVLQQIRRWSPIAILPFVCGAALAYTLTQLGSGQTPDGLWFIFLSGSLAISAMILPGISGSFILVLLEKYVYMMTALKTFDLPVIFTFLAGALVGLLLFSRLLRMLFRRFHDGTVMLMAGFMAGALAKIWPWRQVLATYVDSSGELQPLTEVPVLPGAYAALGKDPQVVGVVLAMVLAFALVVMLHVLAEKAGKKKTP